MPWVSPQAVIVAFLVMGYRGSVYSQPVPWVSPQAVIVAFLVKGYRESVFTHSLCHGFLPEL